MTAQPTEQAAADAIAHCDFPHPMAAQGTGYGCVMQMSGTEKHDGHTLPLAIFAGGKRVALYQVRDSAGRWIKVYH